MEIEQRAGAWRLLGIETESGWRIVEPVGWDPETGDRADHYNGTGGHFSVPYIVEKDGNRAFLKAIDLTRAMDAIDVMKELQKSPWRTISRPAFFRFVRVLGWTRLSSRLRVAN